MRNITPAPHDEPILVDSAASYFGNFGEAFRIRSRARGTGVLTLTGDELVYHRHDGSTHVEIPLEAVQSASVSHWHKGKASLVPVLKITYSGNLVFAVYVAHPEQWVATVQNLISGHRVPAGRGGHDWLLSRPSRPLLILILLLLVCGVVLPLLFSWIRGL